MKMVEQDTELISSHKYIYVWKNSHGIPTELWQKISYNQNYKEGHHVTRRWRKKKEPGWDLCPWEGNVKEEGSPHPGKPLHQWGGQRGQKGSFRRSEKRAAARTQQAKQRDQHRGSLHLPAFPSLRRVPAGICGG